MSTKAATMSDKTTSDNWQLEFLLERRKNQTQKSFSELSTKIVRQMLLEKRYALDAIEKANLQKTLDNLQNCIKVQKFNKSWLVERLESLTRQLALKFMVDDTNSHIFISSDMFYLEIIPADGDGATQPVMDVKVHHEGKVEQQSCAELVSALSRGDFVDFTAQLEGLISIYQLNAEPKIKSKAFVALQALETDISSLAAMQSATLKDAYQMCMQGTVGFMQKRRGGHPMKLTYFVSTFELLDPERKAVKFSLSPELINVKGVGSSVTVNLEASAANKLQIVPLIGASGTSPGYQQQQPHSTMLLPATFVLRLSKATPLCTSLLEQIETITEQKINGEVERGPILALIAKTATEGKIVSLAKGLHVSLPDQTHCYHMTESRSLNGAVISSIPFTDPMHVPKIVKLLRQQAIFNALIASCVRTCGKPDTDMRIFEVTALSHQHISVVLEQQQQLATIEFNLGDVMNIGCSIFCGTSAVSAMAAKIGQLLQTTMSIPVTMRALHRLWELENVRAMLKPRFEAENFSLGHASNDPGGKAGGGPTPAASGARPESGFAGGRSGISGFTDAVVEEKEAAAKGESPKVIQDDEPEFEDNSDSDESLSLDETHLEDEEEEDPLEKKKMEIPPAVSITPVSSTAASLNALGFERRPGIEIIPISATNTKDLPSSITITPINAPKKHKLDDKSSSKLDKERKKKRRRDESPMGPPDPLNKPVSISLQCLPPSVSPKHKQSPKHSPAHSSPKHPGSSPKHGIASPKPPLGAGGKPSMSALKSAATSPSQEKRDSASSLSAAAVASVPAAPTKIRSPSIKLKPVEFDGDAASKQQPPGVVKVRKIGSLNAVIDKLNRAAGQEDGCGGNSPGSPHSAAVNAATAAAAVVAAGTHPNSSSCTNSSSSLAGGASITAISVGTAPQTNSGGSGGGGAVSGPKSSEYMVKHSSDGMKITINKTKSKRSGSPSANFVKSASFTSGNLSGGSSPKTHTGLKPGVNSGPASKKPHSIKNSSSSSSSSRLPFQKSSSSGNLSSKSYSPSKSSNSGISKSSSSSSKDKIRSSKPFGSDKHRSDANDVMKLLGFTSSAQAMEGFMKSLDTKFQIPKISARNSSTGITTSSSSTTAPSAEDFQRKASSSSAPNTPSPTSSGSETAGKLLADFTKYPFSYSGKLPGDISPMHLGSAASGKGGGGGGVSNSPKYDAKDALACSPDTAAFKNAAFNSPAAALYGASPHRPSPTPSPSRGLEEKSAEMAIDYSSGIKRATTPQHSVHATVVPAASPLFNPSPRSTDNFTDDDLTSDLMDEAIVSK